MEPILSVLKGEVDPGQLTSLSLGNTNSHLHSHAYLQAINVEPGNEICMCLGCGRKLYSQEKPTKAEHVNSTQEGDQPISQQIQIQNLFAVRFHASGFIRYHWLFAFTYNLFTACDHCLSKPQIRHLLYYSLIACDYYPSSQLLMLSVWDLIWQNDYKSVWWNISEGGISSLHDEQTDFFLYKQLLDQCKKGSLYVRYNSYLP